MSRVTIITCRLIGLSQADGHFPLLIWFAPLAFQSFQNSVNLVCSEIKFCQFRNDGETFLQTGRLFKGTPVELDRLSGPELVSQCRREQQQAFGFCRIDADRTPQGPEPFFVLAQLKTKLAEEFVEFGVSGCGRNQVAPRLNGSVFSPQFLFECRHLFEIFSTVSSVDRCEPGVDLYRCQKIVLSFLNSGRGHQDRNRL